MAFNLQPIDSVGIRSHWNYDHTGIDVSFSGYFISAHARVTRLNMSICSGQGQGQDQAQLRRSGSSRGWYQSALTLTLTLTLIGPLAAGTNRRRIS